MRFVEFKSKAELSLQREELNEEEAAAMVAVAIDIYEELSSVFDNAIPEWQFRVVEGDAHPWVEQEHHYEAFIVAQSWT